MAKKRTKKRNRKPSFNLRKIGESNVEPEKVYIPELNFAWFDEEEETAVAKDEATEDETAVAEDEEADDEREDAYVIVHPMTVRDKSVLGTYTNKLGLSEISSECIIAALTSRDDDGNLVWGQSRHEAIEYLSNWPEALRPVVTRIATKALELTGDMGDEAIKRAKKN